MNQVDILRDSNQVYTLLMSLHARRAEERKNSRKTLYSLKNQERKNVGVLHTEEEEWQEQQEQQEQEQEQDEQEEQEQEQEEAKANWWRYEIIGADSRRVGGVQGHFQHWLRLFKVQERRFDTHSRAAFNTIWACKVSREVSWHT